MQVGVKVVTEEPTAGALQAKVIVEEEATTEATSALGWPRLVGMLLFGYGWGVVAAHLVPSAETSLFLRPHLLAHLPSARSRGPRRSPRGRRRASPRPHQSP